MGFLQILTAYSSAPHDAKYLAAQSFSSQLAVFEALFLSPRLGQLYLAVFAGLLLRELKQSRPFIYRFIVHVTHYICYSVCFDLATLAISYFRPQSQEDGASEEGVNEMASYIVRDFWIAFLGHAFVAFAGAYSILLLDTDQALLNNLQAGVGGGWVILGPDATVTVFGGGNMGGATTNANPANNADNHGNNNSFTALLSFVATSFTNIFGLATSTTSFALLPGIGLATLNSVPILSTSFAWLFLLHHFTPTELLPLVVFPCLEASAAWHGRLIAPWFSSASHLAFVYILITGWYNGTASWGLTPFILLCMGKPFLLLLFFSAIAPLIVIRELKKKVVNVWRTWFPLPGVAMANEGPKVISPSSSSGVFPNGSQDSAGRSSQARGGQQALSRKDELLDELDDLIDDALEFGVDASYRQPMLPSSSTISSLPVFTRSRRKCPPSTSSQQVPNNETVPAEDHSEASFSSSSSIRSQQIQASRKNPTPAQPVTGPVDYQTPSVRSGDECVYCWTSPRSVLLEPCAHLCLCNECRDLLASKGENQCPVCRRGVEMYRRIYRA